MLNTTRLFFSWHVQSAKSSIYQLRLKPMASFLTMLIIAIALALPSLLWVITDNVNRVTQNWQQAGNISLYLKTSISSSQEKQLLQRLSEMPGVADATLKSADEGLNELSKQEGMQEITRYLPDNPLPAVISVTPSIAFQQPAKLKHLYQQLRADPDVDIAKLDFQWVEKVNALIGFARHISHALMLILATAVVLIIGNTLRLALYNRKDEIQILKLIGATDSFILRPFLYLGICYGLVGAIIAILIVNLVMLSFGVAINHLAYVYQMNFPVRGFSYGQILNLIAFSTILGWFAARLSIKRQLASIEPC